MTRVRSVFLGAALAMLTTACADGPVAPLDAPQFSTSAPIVINFTKAFTGNFTDGPWEWVGDATVPGVGVVELFSSIDLTRIRQTGQALHAPVYWELSNGGDFTMIVETHGIINLSNGIVRTNGRVVSGPYTGATVHQDGQLTGLDAAGFIRIHPATAP